MPEPCQTPQQPTQRAGAGRRARRSWPPGMGIGALVIFSALAAWSPPAACAGPPPYQRAVWIRFEGTITPLLEQFLYRKLQAAEQQGADVVIVEIDSPGGFVESSLNVAHRLRDVDWADTVAFVPRRALSGAAIVALGCDRIIMHPSAVLGDAGPIFLGEDALFRHAPEKVRSDLARQVRDLAAARHRPPALAEAMVDMDLVVYRVRNRQTGQQTYMSEAEIEAAGGAGLWEKGEPVMESRESHFLEVNGKRAVELGLADGNAAGRDDLKRLLGLAEDPIVLEPTAVDTAVFILNLPVVTGLLFAVGLVALWIELSAPGIGLGGLVSLLCFALFFWSRFLGGTAEVLEVVLFLVGVAFLAVEVFVIPGFGVAGVTGLLLMLVSVIMAGQRFLVPSTGRELETFSTSLLVVACSGGVFVLAAMALSRYFHTLPVFSRLVLRPRSDVDRPAEEDGDERRGSPVQTDRSHEAQIGDRGIAVTPLRPAGKARFGDRVLDVLTDGDFVEPGHLVEIVEIVGNRITVRQQEKPP